MKLSPQQEKFCQNYILNGFNATKAYLDAYSCKSEKTASASGTRLLGNVKIKQRLTELQKETHKDFTITREQILQELAKMAFGNIGHLIDIKGGRITLRDDLTSDQKQLALASISSVGASYSDGEKGMSKSFTIQNKDKLKALELIARMTGALDGSDSNQGNGRAKVSRVLESIRRLKK